MTQKLGVGQGNKSVWRFAVVTWCYSLTTGNCLQICGCKQLTLHCACVFLG